MPAQYVKDGEPTSEPDNIQQAQRPVRELYGTVDARDFGPLALKAVRQAMIGAAGVGPSSTGKSTGSSGVRLGGQNELVPIETYQALASVAGLRRGRTEAREKPPVRPVPDKVVERVLPHLSPTVATMVRVQRLAGMRPQEVILMRATTSTCPTRSAGSTSPDGMNPSTTSGSDRFSSVPEPKNFCGRTWTPHPRATCSAPGQPRNSGVWIGASVEGLP